MHGVMPPAAFPRPYLVSLHLERRQSGLCSPAVPSSVTNLFVQVDLFVAADEALVEKAPRVGLHRRGGPESSVDPGFHQYALQPPPDNGPP